MHALASTTSIARLLVIIASAAVAATHATRADSSAEGTEEMMFVFNPAEPNEPATDNVTRVTEAETIVLPPYPRTKHPDGIRGRLAVRVQDDGSIARVRFESPRPPKAVADEIARGLSLWRFEPLTRFGRPIDTWVSLVFSSTPSPVPGADAPPRSLFAVMPDYPYELWRPWARTGAAAPVVSLPSDSAPVTGSGANPPPVGDNKRVGVAAVRSPLGQPGSGPSTSSHTTWFSGYVALRVDVDAAGLPTGLEVVRSTGSCFEPLAAAAAMNNRFTPATKDGKPVAARLIVPMSFLGSLANPPPLFFKPVADPGEAWDEPPRLRYLDLPVYPRDLLAANITGRASARVELDAAGSIAKIDLIEATRPEFGHALVASIERCLHDPARRGGKRVGTTIVRTAVFETQPWNSKPNDHETPALILDSVDGVHAVTEDTLDQPLVRLVGRPPAFAVAATPEAPASAIVEFFVSSAGEVQAPRVVSASTPAAGYAAVQAVAAWRYAPPVSRGAPASVSTRLSFTSR